MLRRTVSLTTLTLLSMAGVCLAQPETPRPPDPAKGSETAPSKRQTIRPWSGDEAQSRDRVRSSEEMTFSDGTSEIKVRIEDGEASGFINGKRLDPSRIQRDERGVRVLGEDGSVIHEFPAPPTAQPPASTWISIDREPPKVMIGITMSTSHDGDGVLVDSVIEGLPASKAGLEEGDRIIKARGKKVTDDNEFRSVLQELAPGETVELVVVRDDAEKSISIMLEAFDGRRLGRGQSMMTMPAQPDRNALQAQAHKDISEAIRSVDGLSRQQRMELEAKLRAVLTKSLAMADVDRQSILQMLPGLPVDGGTLMGGNPDNAQGNMIFALPRKSGENDDLNRKLDRLMKKMEMLEDRLSELTQNLENGKVKP